MRKMISGTVAGVLLAVFATVGHAAGDPVAGEHKARACAVCHGQEGIAISPLFPNLAGQQEAYMISALKAFRSEERRGASAEIMWGQAATLSDEDIADLAAYFSGLGSDF